MHIRKIQLSNVRGFREVDLDLVRPNGSLVGWTVLAGRNGSGKSTLLKAMALAVVGPEAARALNPSFIDWIKTGSHGAEVGVKLEEFSRPSMWLSWHRSKDAFEPSLVGHASTKKNARHDVYLSFQEEDRAEVLDIATRLQSYGIRPWIDEWELRPVMDWPQALGEAMRSIPAAIFFLGKSVIKGRSQHELDFLLQVGERLLIPVVLRSHASDFEIPAPLNRLRWVDFRQADPDPLEELIWGITGEHPRRKSNAVGLNAEVSENSASGFLAGYGPLRRLTGHAVDAQRLMEGPPHIARVVSLFREDASLVESVTWLKEIYLQRLEEKPGAMDLEKSVLDLLNDGLLPDDTQVEQIDSEGLWTIQHGVRLPLRELSDGYRTVAALVMDIVRHLHRTFGALQIEQAEDPEGPFLRILHPGVVLIDEVDLHLHVSWQKRIGFWLKRHFPQIQFIVTTHSPFICQAADPRGLIRLPAPGEDRPVEHVSEELYNTVVHGSLDDAVLTELFGLDTPYSEETERLRETVAQLEAKLQTGTATEQDRTTLREMRSRLPRTMSSSVEQALRTLAAEG